MPAISKSEFARRRNVTPARVTQWIAAGQIYGDAIDGEGRSARIVEAIAIEQLRRTRNIDQAHSGNGLGTRLELDEPAARATPHSEAPLASGSSAPGQLAGELSAAPRLPTTEDKIAAARLEGLERANRRAQIEEAQELGQLVHVDQARAAAAREIRQVIARFEGALSDLSNAIAAEFKLEPRAVLHLLRSRFREIRRAGAIEARERAEPLADRVGHEIGEAPAGP